MSQDERIALVDKDDNVTGYKMRSELTDDDCWRIVCVWVENTQQQTLLQQRSFELSVNPGLWSMAVVGTVNDNDSYHDTALRETQEEIGLSDFKLTKVNKIHYKASFGWRVAQGFIVKCDWKLEQFKPQPEEVLQLEWVSKQQVLDELTDKIPHSREYTNAYNIWPELFDLK